MSREEAMKELDDALKLEEEEARRWMYRRLPSGDDMVNVELRNMLVSHMIRVGVLLEVEPHVPAYGAVIFDRLLSTGQLKKKDARAAICSSLFLAIKSQHRDKKQPPIRKLLNCFGFSLSMSEFMLGKQSALQMLDNNLTFVTPFTFVSIIVSPVPSKFVKTHILNSVQLIIHEALNVYPLLQVFKPSIIAYTVTMMFIELSSSSGEWILHGNDLGDAMKVDQRMVAMCRSKLEEVTPNDKKRLFYKIVMLINRAIDHQNQVKAALQKQRGH